MSLPIAPEIVLAKIFIIEGSNTFQRNTYFTSLQNNKDLRQQLANQLQVPPTSIDCLLTMRIIGLGQNVLDSQALFATKHLAICLRCCITWNAVRNNRKPPEAIICSDCWSKNHRQTMEVATTSWESRFMVATLHCPQCGIRQQYHSKYDTIDDTGIIQVEGE